MPTFIYKARSKIAKGIFEGEIEAETREEAAARLLQKGFLPSHIEKKKRKYSFAALLSIGNRLRKISLENQILFTSQMATLFRAGIPLITTFDGLIEQAGNKKLKKILIDIKARVEEGISLNEAMREYPEIFSETFTNMIMAGEVSGTLDESLDRLTKLLEREFETENRIKEVTRYPKIVVGSIVIAVVVLMFFVVPRFIQIFERARLELPLATKMLIFLNHAFQNYWYIGLIAIALAWFAFSRYVRTENGRYRWHYYLLRAPLVGDITCKLKLGQFCNVLANMVKSGIPILQAIDISAHAAGNDYLTRIFREVRESVKEGSGMADPLKRFKIVPPIVAQMIAAGEKSGALDDMLLKVADYFKGDADRKIRELSSLIEPILIFLLGGIVLFIALAVLLPMWDMAKLAGR